MSGKSGDNCDKREQSVENPRDVIRFQESGQTSNNENRQKNNSKVKENVGSAEGNESAAPSDLSTKARGAGQQDSVGAVVAAHYNTLEEKGLDERSKSRIVYLRNFNNWVKSMLINEYLTKVKQGKNQGDPIKVLDIGCGKGGDLLKWRKGAITHLICSDIAETSVEQCQSRYKDLQQKSRNDRGYEPVFSAEFIVADCTKVRLKDQYKDPSMQLDLVSCQFAFHYCFESLSQADQMVQNAAESLRPGGYFIGTIPDAYNIMKRHQESEGKFGNEIYNVEFECSTKEPFPLFGAKYKFHLEGVVDCPEFLVHFPTLIRLAEKHNLQFVAKEKFEDFYEKMKEEGRSLLAKMQALETYPPYHEAPLLGKPEEYEHAQQYMQTKTGHRRVGTLSRSEWEAASLYLVFAFKKVGPGHKSKPSGEPPKKMQRTDEPSSGGSKEGRKS